MGMTEVTQPEHYGPLVVERRRKADGRALILYWRTPTTGELREQDAELRSDEPRGREARMGAPRFEELRRKTLHG
jgi:hypothetical protein